MKFFFMFVFFVSLGANMWFLNKKIQRINRANEQDKLLVYKTISHKEGYDFFKKQLRKNYPETNLDKKYFIVYMWDSLTYDFIYRDQMKKLDSMANSFKNYKLEYIFATEMEEVASKDFLKRNYDEYKHIKMLYGMDNYISGLYSVKYINLIIPNVIKMNPSNKEEEAKVNYKQKILYLIMDSEGQILFTNGDKYRPTSDTAFLNKLKNVLPNKDFKILN